MKLNLLSVDLDWFNSYDYRGLKNRVRTFFYDLSNQCNLGTDVVTVLTDHHYMYPWSWELMRLYGADSVDVVNVDTHHDFYFLDSVCFDDDRAQQITCGNFFAFMAHEGILGRYDWVTSVPSFSNALKNEVIDFEEYLAQADSLKVKKVINRTHFWYRENVLHQINNRFFHGLAVIKSPEFTTRYKTVINATQESLDTYFPSYKVRSHTCTKDFPYKRRNVRMRRLVA